MKCIKKVTHLKSSLTYMLGGKKYQFNKEWPRLGLLKVKSKSSHSKIHNYLLVKIQLHVTHATKNPCNYLKQVVDDMQLHMISIYTLYSYNVCIHTFLIINKLIKSQPLNKLWIKFWHVFICESQLRSDNWHLIIIFIFNIINKLIIYQPFNKTWIRIWYVFICEGQIYGVMWQFKKPIHYSN
jgi:hypothetical protein